MAVLACRSDATREAGVMFSRASVFSYSGANGTGPRLILEGSAGARSNVNLVRLPSTSLHRSHNGASDGGNSGDLGAHTPQS